MNRSMSISSMSLSMSCDDDCASQVDWLSDILTRLENERGPGFYRDGVRIQVGWSLLTVVSKDENAFVVCEPDFAGDAIHDLREDITCTLRVQTEQNSILNRLHLEGVAARFQDKLVFEKGCLDGRRLVLERKAPSAGNSGWYIGPAEPSADSPNYEAIYVYQLLKIRSSLLKYLSLPPGYMVVIDGESGTIIDEDNNPR